MDLPEGPITQYLEAFCSFGLQFLDIRSKRLTNRAILYTNIVSSPNPNSKKVCVYLPVEAMLSLSKVRTHNPTTRQIRVSLQQGISADTVQPKLSIHTAPEHGQVVLVSRGAESTFWGGPDNTPPIRQTPKGRERLRGSYRWATKDISIVVDGPRDSLKSCGTDDILSLSSVRQQSSGKM